MVISLPSLQRETAPSCITTEPYTTYPGLGRGGDRCNKKGRKHQDGPATSPGPHVSRTQASTSLQTPSVPFPGDDEYTQEVARSGQGATLFIRAENKHVEKKETQRKVCGINQKATARVEGVIRSQDHRKLKDRPLGLEAAMEG